MMKNKGNDRNPALVLASESSARRSILAGLKLVFDVIAPDFEERVHPSASPTEIALINAEGKARAVDAGFSSDCRPAAIVIGSDQVCCTESGLILHKPGSVDRAIDQLMQASSQRLTFYSSLVLIMDGKVARSTVETCAVKLRRLTKDDIRAYVAADNPLWSAGSFHAEGAGLRLIETIETTDINVLYGLPALALLRFLRELKVPLAYAADT
jgi:septum formation protein|tara:strand:+ start:260 stop:895 length:636 start_codon:yes stop_codon:yes gene_type:complete